MELDTTNVRFGRYVKERPLRSRPALYASLTADCSIVSVARRGH
jgi:hypothetical protein